MGYSARAASFELYSAKFEYHASRSHRTDQTKREHKKMATNNAVILGIDFGMTATGKRETLDQRWLMTNRTSL